MQKIWKLNQSKFNKVILIHDKVIYKGNPRPNDINRLNVESVDHAFLKDLFGIPYSYIRQIENQSGENFIRIFFGKDSEEVLQIENENIKNEIFEYLKSDMPNLAYTVELPSVITYAKAPIFALVSISAIFIWSLYLSIQIEDGVEYELVGGGNPGITGIVLAIANLGSLKIIIGYIILLGISIFALVKQLKSRTETEFLKR